jgi:cytochrome c oxidase assembly protein subunit 15
MKLFWLAFTAAAVIFLVNIIGFIDTMTNSAMGCGSGYPLCNGMIIPDFHDYHSVIEYTHRIVVGIASILLFTVSIISWFRYKTIKMKMMVLLAILGILGESTLGALTVMIKLSPALLAAHLGIALISFSALCNIAYIIYLKEKNINYIDKVSTKFSKCSWLTFVILYLAIYFGGYVAKTGSGGFFRGFPIPTENFSDAGMALWIDIVHRLFALLLILFFIYLSVLAKRNKRIRPDLYSLSKLCVVLIIFQGLSGGLLIYTHLSLMAVLFHVSALSLLVGALSIICFQTYKKVS